MAWLLAIGQQLFSWAAKVFLGGLFSKVMTEESDEASHKIDASVVQGQTTTDSANVDVQIVKDQSTVKDHYNDKPENPADPFDNSDWNGGVKK